MVFILNSLLLQPQSDQQQQQLSLQQQQQQQHYPVSYSTIYHQQSHNIRPLPLLSNTSPRPKGYLDLYQSRAVIRSVSTETTFNKHITNSNSTDTVQNNFEHNDGTDADTFATTWPRSNGYYSSFMKTNGRQTSTETVSIPPGKCNNY